jgi:asparagine synthetase B (glutamine-hydrolysing)
MFDDPVRRYLELNQRVPPRTALPLDTYRRLFSDHSDVVAQMGHTDALTTLQDLIKMDDRGCSHVGLESRSPFLDHRIVEFAFRLPSRFKIRPGGITKWILREVAREFVPPEIVNRPDKMGMVSPVGIWLRRELKEWSDGLVTALRARSLDLPFEPPEENAYDRRTHALVSLELWFRRFIDPTPASGRQP